MRASPSILPNPSYGQREFKIWLEEPLQDTLYIKAPAGHEVSINNGSTWSNAVEKTRAYGSRIVGSYSAFASMSSNGVVTSWGDLTRNGTSGTINPFPTGGISNAAKIYSNYGAFAVITSSGGVVVWGDVLYGGGPIPSGISSQLTDIVNIVPNENPFGGSFAAYKSDGRVFVWGYENAGALQNLPSNHALRSYIQPALATNGQLTGINGATNSNSLFGWQLEETINLANESGTIIRIPSGQHLRILVDESAQVTTDLTVNGNVVNKNDTSGFVNGGILTTILPNGILTIGRVSTSGPPAWSGILKIYRASRNPVINLVAKDGVYAATLANHTIVRFNLGSFNNYISPESPFPSSNNLDSFPYATPDHYIGNSGVSHNISNFEANIFSFADPNDLTVLNHEVSESNHSRAILTAQKSVIVGVRSGIHPTQGIPLIRNAPSNTIFVTNGGPTGNILASILKSKSVQLWGYNQDPMTGILSAPNNFTETIEQAEYIEILSSGLVVVYLSSGKVAAWYARNLESFESNYDSTTFNKLWNPSGTYGGSGRKSVSVQGGVVAIWKSQGAVVSWSTQLPNPGFNSSWGAFGAVGITNAQQLATSGSHIAVIRNDGSVRVWGSDNNDLISSAPANIGTAAPFDSPLTVLVRKPTESTISATTTNESIGSPFYASLGGQFLTNQSGDYIDVTLFGRPSRRIYLSLEGTAPTVVTVGATDETSFSVYLNGDVTSDGGEGVSERGFVISPTNNPPLLNQAGTTQISHDDADTGPYSTEVTDLSSDTTYYFRAYAENTEGVAYGATGTFTTEEESTPTPTLPLLIGSMTVTALYVGDQPVSSLKIGEQSI